MIFNWKNKWFSWYHLMILKVWGFFGHCDMPIINDLLLYMITIIPEKKSQNIREYIYFKQWDNFKFLL